ncbi:aspartyl protease family protein 1-like [Senna tora]|uniref:Aspartyl protease family protein 1-like n=1 Tax=Senna tora TaxID=362788 RepID=A0A834WS93_9FABA|nr:aspartyl protease family protein 1-like [Senna tora]
MAWSFSPSSLCRLLFLVLSLASQSCNGLRTFGFDIHHRYSDPVKGILGIEELPEKGSREYYVAMSHRDRIFRGRGLAGSDGTPLTFAGGNETYRLSSFGYLHYANVTVGTPALSFLVALDTGSDLFWLPCNCNSSTCVQSLQTSNGQSIKLNIYGPSASSTSKNVFCNSTLCQQQNQCPSSSSNCPYEILYLSNGTSSAGILVEDVLHLITDDNQTKEADTRITFGCGQVQTGSFLSGAAPNGLFGLGMDSISVPSILAKQGLTSNSFSMCFGSDGLGRIRFGDNGSSDQLKTSFNLKTSQPTYNVSITQIVVGGNAADLEFNAIFDSGTSFTYLNDPAYTQITTSFNTMIKENRSNSEYQGLPFEFCYDLSANQTNFEVPLLNLTMKGGDNYNVNDPILLLSNGNEAVGYCLGIVKSDDVNIIGQNFMTGYNIVFDRDNMILGWKDSDCNGDELSNSNASPTNGSHTPPALAANPEDTSNKSNDSFKTNPFTFTFIMVLFLLLAIV